MNATLLAVIVAAALYLTFKVLSGADSLVALFTALLWALVWGSSRAIIMPETGDTIQSEPLATLGFFGVLIVGAIALSDLLSGATNF